MNALFPMNQPAPVRVECLGMTFASDEERRAYFTERLREKLRDPEFRKIEGFPIGSDEDILALSDPPYYTACPNPFITDFIHSYGRPYDPDVPYHRAPLAIDVSEGKTDRIYSAHSYHTKVPYKAIIPAILHYTEPGDLVLDGFCGTGMTGVAAQICDQPDPELKAKLESEWHRTRQTQPHWGTRRVVLNDLGPIATFISANYNLPFDVQAFEREATRLLDDLSHEIGWMYETLHTDGKTRGRINYTVWSEVFACPNCAGEIIFVDEALEESGHVRLVISCPHCRVELTKQKLDRLYETIHDSALGKSIQLIKRKPVIINYTIGTTKYEKKPDAMDLELLHQIAEQPLPTTVPTIEIPYMHMTHERARMKSFGITHIHHFFLPRAAHALGILWAKATAVENAYIRHMLLFFVEQALWTGTLLNRYRPTGYSQVNQYLTGVYYVASQHSECSPWYMLEGKLQRLIKTFVHRYAQLNQALITTGTAARVGLPDHTVDYIFTDPPFGENIYYADLNFLIESWHRVWTNAIPEAIVDQAKHKGLADYQHLMQHCFVEYYRVLKPGRWITIVFHNSRNTVWNAIQEALLAAGFVVADVRTLDKQQGSYRQITSSAVKQDLIISAYKPNGGLEERFRIAAGTEQGAWDFVQAHLRQVPICITKSDKIEVVAERIGYFLFDRMVAFHVQRGVSVPLSGSEFQSGIARRFPERDGMYFLPEQIEEYERKRMTVREVQQLQIFISDESTAIQWVRQQLLNKPQTVAELTPQFMRELKAWQKHEVLLELRSLLEENFLIYDSVGAIPTQILVWLRKSSDMRGVIEAELASGAAHEENSALYTTHQRLIHAACDRWYVPDPNKAIDLEKLRLKSLLKEFGSYHEGKGRLKQFRTEAVKAGFKHAWNEKDYHTIMRVAERLPESVLQEDPDLLMYYDNANLRVG
ncbi:MAG: DNA methyltransferase [Chloroflexales bacterium]